MKISEFAHKYQFTGRDKTVVEKVYDKVEKTEEQWLEELKDKIVFEIPSIEKTEETIVNTSNNTEDTNETSSTTDDNKSNKTKTK